jgi:hypothetical protein
LHSLRRAVDGAEIVYHLAAIVTTSKMPLANPQKVVGFLGGMDIPVINDFKVGYEQGVKYIDKDVSVLVSYVGNFSDSAKGKELMMAQYDQGADIGFNVAGQAGLGLLDAANDKKRYAMDQRGVSLWDRDVLEAFIRSDPEKPGRYTEYQVAPTNERLDLSLDLPNRDFAWNSGFESAVKADKNVVEFKMAGRGRFMYAATLYGFSPDTKPVGGNIGGGQLAPADIARLATTTEQKGTGKAFAGK